MKNKLTPLLLAGVLAITSIPMSFATEGGSVKVTCDIASGYELTLPKEITLSGANKQADFTISTSNLNLASGQTLNVTADSAVTMTQEGKSNATAYIKRQKVSLHDDTYPLDPGVAKTEAVNTIMCSDLTAGSWEGAFNFNVEVKDFEKIALNPPNQEAVDEAKRYLKSGIITSGNGSVAISSTGKTIELETAPLSCVFGLSNKNRQLLEDSLINANVIVKGAMSLGYVRYEDNEQWTISNTYKPDKTLAGIQSYSFTRGDNAATNSQTICDFDIYDIPVDSFEELCQELTERAGVGTSGIVTNRNQSDNYYNIEFCRKKDEELSAEDAINGYVYNPLAGQIQYIDYVDEWLNSDEFKNAFGFDNTDHKYFESYGNPTTVEVPETTIALSDVVSRDTTEIIIPTDAFEDISIILHHFTILEGDSLVSKWVTVFKTGNAMINAIESN